jgi:hypothetical protein
MSMIDARRDNPGGFDERRMMRRSSANSLRQQLIGTWRLVSYVDRDVDSGEETHPMGERPLGYIIYTQDGFMSAQLSTRNRPRFRFNDPYAGTPEEYAEAASTYFAYCGSFHVGEFNQSLTHEMQVCLFPNWLGQRQVRLAQIDGDLLRLSTTPMNFRGSRKTASLVWQRVQPKPASASWKPCWEASSLR